MASGVVKGDLGRWESTQGAVAEGAWLSAAIMLHLPEVKGTINDFRIKTKGRHWNHLQVLLSDYEAFMKRNTKIIKNKNILNV